MEILSIDCIKGTYDHSDFKTEFTFCKNQSKLEEKKTQNVNRPFLKRGKKTERKKLFYYV